MPRLSEAKKDVISCEKLRGSAHTIRSVDIRMGQPSISPNHSCYGNYGVVGPRHLMLIELEQFGKTDQRG